MKLGFRDVSQLQISRSDAVIFPATGFLGLPERPRCSTDHYTEMKECSTGIMPLHKEFLYWSWVWPLPGLNLNRHLRISVSVTEDSCGWEGDHFWCLKLKVAALLLHCHYRQVSHMAWPEGMKASSKRINF